MKLGTLYIHVPLRALQNTRRRLVKLNEQYLALEFNETYPALYSKKSVRGEKLNKRNNIYW